ncbi:hypothetical protein [Roseovarius sp.]
MSFVRPEATAALWRWREVLAGGAVLAVGLWWAFGTVGLLHWLGYVIAAAGAVLVAAGVQRGRFRSGQDGPGVVTVVEGQIAYFGPLTGGMVALGELSQVSLDPTGRPQHWILSQPGQPDLAIPLTASGADALFDAFATLPGIRTEHMLAQMKRHGNAPVIIWQKSYPRLH